MAKLYWRIKKNGKWTWKAAKDSIDKRKLEKEFRLGNLEKVASWNTELPQIFEEE